MKTHYVTLRLLFSDHMTKQQATKLATETLINKEWTTSYPVTNPETKAVTRELRSFKVKRVC